MSAISLDPNPNTSTTRTTQLNGQRLWLGRIIWLVIFTYTMALFIIAIPARFQSLQTACTDNCVMVQASESGAIVLEESLGLSLTMYAVIINSKEILLSLLFIFSGLLVFWRRSDDWLVIFISLTLIIAGPSFGVFFVLDNPAIKVLQGLGLVLLTNLLCLFPDGRFVPSWLRWFGAVFGLLLFILTITPLSATPIWSISFLGIFVIGFFSQIYRYRRVATPIQRQQTKWIIYGFGMLIVGGIFLLTPPLLFPSILTPLTQPTATVADFVYRGIIGFFLGFLLLYCFPISIAISTLRYRLWDADPIINRSLVYGFMTLAVVVLLFMITLLTQFIFGNQQPIVAILMAGVICLLAFNSARQRIQHWVDRHIYGFRYDQNELQAALELPVIKNPGALTGQVIDGYEIGGVIGRGGMGEVYRGLGNGRQVAIKTMLPEFAENNEMRMRFEREARVGQSLNHRNIAQVLANGVLNDTPFLIMEFVEGIDLSTRLKQEGAIDTESTINILQSICSALDIVHQQGFVHRDLKPSNIMIRENGEVLLMDFGIMKMHDATLAITGSGAIGTIDYMSPEQIMAAKEVDYRADIYALGVMVYEMLTGEKPFSGSPAQVMFAHIQQPSPDIRKKDATIPLNLAHAIDKAMAKNPEDRFSSVGEFAQALMS